MPAQNKIGLSGDKVALSDHDPYWNVIYVEEAVNLCRIFGDAIATIDHFGSTAISIKAKPVIDILVQTYADDIAPEIEQKLVSSGYTERVFPDRAERMFFKGPQDNRTHQVHFTKLGSDFAKKMIRFRDILRAEPQLAKEYEDIKVNLAEKFPDDRQGYYKSKIAFFEKVLAR